MNEIIDKINSLKEDKQIVITDDLIKTYIEDNIESLIKEIKGEI